MSILILMFAFSTSQAITIVQVKGRKVLLNLEGAKVVQGQQFTLVGDEGKPVGLIKIGPVKKDKALALLISGKAIGKLKVQASVSAAPTLNAAPQLKSKEPSLPEGPRVPYMASILLGLASNTLSVRITNGITSQNVDNTGNSVGLALAVDRQYFQPWFRARAIVSYEQFNAIGASTITGCNNQTSRDCQTDIKYLSTGLYGKYEKNYSRFNVWGAGGLNLKIPISKSSTALVESSLGPTISYGLTLGGDYTLETKNFVTASLEKQFYIKSDSAETSTLFIRFGVGKQF